LKRIAISQSNFIPWLGYFDLIRSVDVFVVYDVVQFTRRDWRNRNRIKTPKGAEWVTVPVQAKGNYLSRIDEIAVAGYDWIDSFKKTLVHNYSRAEYFSEISLQLFSILERKHRLLHDLNLDLIKWILEGLAIKTELIESPVGLFQSEDRNLRLIEIVKGLSGDIYVSAPAALGYLEVELFNKNGLELEIFRYPEYPRYRQMFGEFIGQLTALDILFNEGWDGAKVLLLSSSPRLERL
jgi:hypothetical protein